MILAALACPVFTSCYDDSKLWAEVGILKDKVTSLEEQLKNELAVFQYILSPDAKISDAKWDEANGVWKFTLADGTSYEFVQPSADQYNSLITMVEVDGAKYWATYVNGVATAITDADNNMYPVSVTPEVKTEEGVTYLTLDGKTWLPVSSSDTEETPAVFVDVQYVYTDNYTDEQEAEGYMETAVAVTFTLADYSQITVAINDAGFFTIGNIYMGPAPEMMFIPVGSTYVQEAMGMNVVDIVVSGPSGWLVEEEMVYDAEGMKQYALNITAPRAECIAEGHALAGGYIKVIAFLEGGKQTVSKMFVTSDAFQTFSASNGNVSMVPTYGNFVYYYGIVEAGTDLSEIEAAIVELGADAMYMGYQYAMNNGYEDDGTRNEAVSKILEGAEYGKSYVLWAYPSVADDRGYSFPAGAMTSMEFVYQSIAQDEDVLDIKFNAINTKISFNGVTEFYGGVGEYYDEIPTADDYLSTFNMYMEYGMASMFLKSAPDSGVFVGNPLELLQPGSSVVPGKNYYVWFVIPREGAKRYTDADAILYTYNVPLPVAGGSAVVEMAQQEVTGNNKYSQISVKLSAENAEYIYYEFVDPEVFATIEDKAAFLLSKDQVISKDQFESAIDVRNLAPEARKILLAMAVDADGKYGEVAVGNYAVPAYEYNNIKLSVQLIGDAVKGYNSFKITAEGGEVAEYCYLFVKTDDYAWYNNLGGSYEIAEAKIATGYRTNKATVDSTGVFSNPYANSYGDWILLVAAKDKDGVFSRLAHLEVKVMFNLGNFVSAKDINGNDNPTWVEAKPTVAIETSTVGDFTHVSWSVSNVPAGYTAQTFIIHDDYLVDYPTGKDKANYILTSGVIELQEVTAEEDRHEYGWGSPGDNVWVLLKDAEGNYYEPYKYECNITSIFGQ